MDFNTFDKIFDSFRKHPKRTILILCIMALVALSAIFLKSYFDELGKKAELDSEAEKNTATGIQIGEIKTGDQILYIVSL